MTPSTKLVATLVALTAMLSSGTEAQPLMKLEGAVSFVDDSLDTELDVEDPRVTVYGSLDWQESIMCPDGIMVLRAEDCWGYSELAWILCPESRGPKMTQQQLDLHGMTQRDAVEAFVAESNAALERAGAPVTMRLIHGYGSTGEGGVPGARLRGFCDSHPDRASYVRGEDAERNPGLTIVTVESPLPDARQRLGDAIVEFVETHGGVGRS